MVVSFSPECRCSVTTITVETTASFQKSSSETWLTRVVLTPPFKFMKTILSLMTRKDRSGHFTQVLWNLRATPFSSFKDSFVKPYLPETEMGQGQFYKGW